MEYFDVQTRDGVIVLTPVRIQRGDAMRAKLGELALGQADLDAAVGWARKRVAEPRANYLAKPPAAAAKKTARKSSQRK